MQCHMNLTFGTIRSCPKTYSVQIWNTYITFSEIMDALPSFTTENSSGEALMKWKKSDYLFSANDGDTKLRVKSPSQKYNLWCCSRE